MADLPKPGSAVKRDRALADGELGAVWRAAERLGWPFGPAVRLLILTAARRDEIGALRWSEIHGNAIHLPAERSKSGEERIIPLSPTAVELIATLPRSGLHVFTTNGSRAVSGWSKAKRALDAAVAEINGSPLEPWRTHDLRRTIATNLQRLGVGLQTVESILGHVGGSRAGIVGVYQRHRYQAEMRAALETWAGEVDRIVRGKEPPKIVFAAATFAGEGGLAVDAEVRAVDREWLAAITRADATNSPDSLIAYLHRPDVKLGPSESFLLRLLLERVHFKRAKGGGHVPAAAGLHQGYCGGPPSRRA